jgi:hypothetical protein
MTVCQCCGQPIRQVERLGIRMSPMKAKIFDMVKAAGDRGIDGESLHIRLYCGRDKKPQYHAIHINIFQLNELLDATPYRISSIEGSYRMVLRSEWVRPTNRKNCVVCNRLFIQKPHRHRKTCSALCASVAQLGGRKPRRAIRVLEQRA